MAEAVRLPVRECVGEALRFAVDNIRFVAIAAAAGAGALMLLHERFGVLIIVLSAFGRAVSEVGAVMIVGGNIDGITRVMTTTIALETSKGDLPLALALGFVLLGVVGLIYLVVGAVQGQSSVEREVLI